MANNNWQGPPQVPLPTFLQTNQTGFTPNPWLPSTPVSEPQTFNLDPSSYTSSYSVPSNPVYYVPQDTSFSNYANYGANYQPEPTAYSSQLPSYQNYANQVPQYSSQNYSSPTTSQNYSSPTSPTTYQNNTQYSAAYPYQNVTVNDQNYYTGVQQLPQQTQQQPQQQLQQPQQLPQQTQTTYQPQGGVVQGGVAQGVQEVVVVNNNTSPQSGELDDVEGWLWQLNEQNQWKQLYFILDHNTSMLLGFTSYPMPGSNIIPCQTLKLGHPLQVTEKFPNVQPIAGFCFGIIKPSNNNNEYFVFDTINDYDQSRWIAWFKYYTKEVAAQAWLPWQSQENEKLVELQQEKERQMKEQEENLKKQKEEEIAQAMMRVNEQHLGQSAAAVVDYHTQLARLNDEVNEIKQEIETQRQTVTPYINYLPQIQDEPTRAQYHSYISAVNNDIDQKTSSLQAKEREVAEVQRLITESDAKNYQQVQQQSPQQSQQIVDRDRILQEEREKIRQEIEKQYAEELALKRKQEEEKWLEEKRQLQANMLEEQNQQVFRWLDENPSWRTYYLSIGVTEDELKDAKFVRNLIKNTAQFVLSSSTPSVKIDLMGVVPNSPMRMSSSSNPSLPTDNNNNYNNNNYNNNNHHHFDQLPPGPPPPVPDHNNDDLPPSLPPLPPSPQSDYSPSPSPPTSSPPPLPNIPPPNNVPSLPSQPPPMPSMAPPPMSGPPPMMGGGPPPPPSSSSRSSSFCSQTENRFQFRSQTRSRSFSTCTRIDDGSNRPFLFQYC